VVQEISRNTTITVKTGGYKHSRVHREHVENKGAKAKTLTKTPKKNTRHKKTKNHNNTTTTPKHTHPNQKTPKEIRDENDVEVVSLGGNNLRTD